MNATLDAATRGPLRKARVKALGAALLWSLVVVLSLWVQRGQIDRSAEALARIDAQANLKKDMAIRKWAASVGGVFINEEALPDLGTLQEQERLSGVKENGKPFKLITLTPIHILQAVQAISNQEYGVRERLTSQQLHNRANAPDDWEAKALKSLEDGAPIASETVKTKNGHGLMRLMIPMRMDKECLECHRDTLVPVGGLRGGAAITIDLNTYRSAQEPTWRAIQYWHFGIWLLGLAGISAFSVYNGRRLVEQASQEEQRRENEAAFSAMAEGAIVTDPNGTILWVNDAFCRIFGYERDEVIGKNPRILKSGRHSAEEYSEFWRQLTAAGHWRGELWNRRKTGEVFPEEISIQALRGADGRILRYISIFSDITERKRNDEELRRSQAQLQELTGFLQTAREEERTRIARELHDELGQALTVLRIDLSWLQGKCPKSEPAVINRLEGAYGLVERTVNAVRRISADLRPPMLDDLGLAAAIEHHVRGFAERTGIACELNMDREEFDLANDAATTLFRVVQEALTNAARHSGAKHVTIDIEEAEDGVHLVVADDGRGFDASAAPPGFGLLGMRERVKMQGGRLAIESAPGAGTRVEAWLPIATEEQA
ncbi:MAG: PAS domain S-box protein [Ignavibacteria bacterium]